jgi:dolichol-phosphate mannosyltransferase
LIGIIIPVKNEPYLPYLLNSIDKEVSISHKVYVQTEKGLSKAVLIGFKKALSEGCTELVVMDGDGSHNPKYVLPMINHLTHYDIVIGSRYILTGRAFNNLTKITSKDSKVKMRISGISCSFFSGSLGLKVIDCMSGFVAIKCSVISDLLPKLNPIGIKFMLEILVHSKGKYIVGEYPIVFEQRKSGYSKNGFTQAIRTYVFTIKLSIQKLGDYFG